MEKSFRPRSAGPAHSNSRPSRGPRPERADRPDRPDRGGYERPERRRRTGFAARRPRADFPRVSHPTPGEMAHLRTLAEAAKTAESGFSKMGLDDLLLGALQSMEFSTPTPVQEKGIPVALAGSDILGSAQTGSGKTLAFVIPILQSLLTKPEGRALILVPTRELGLQIEEVVKPLTKKLDLGLPALLIGGVSYGYQFRMIDMKPKIIIATPGRLIDHLHQESFSLEAFTHLVLDEADRMLDVGFKPQLNEILTFLKNKPQTMMFTATLSRDVKMLVQKYLKQPVSVQIGDNSRVNQNITQTKLDVDAGHKTEKVLELLKEHPGTALLFVQTQIKTERVAKMLMDFGVEATPIHGGLSQGQRRRALDSFRDERVRVLVATDVAARGLDIDHVNLVINFDLPLVAEDYVHRIGRTGRAGRKGNAISLVSRDQAHLWRIIARQFLPESERPKYERPERGGGGGGGDRKERGFGRARPPFKRGGPKSSARPPFKFDRRDRSPAE